jgi:hypothetical protein
MTKSGGYSRVRAEHVAFGPAVDPDGIDTEE